MKKNYIFILISLFTLNFYNAQTSTEDFETETHGSKSFTDNGVVFNIISNGNIFSIQANNPDTGWNGTANDNRYIDNLEQDNLAGASFSIKTTSNLFKVNKFWLYAGSTGAVLNSAGTVIISGKKSGVIKFQQTKTTGFNISSTDKNGFTLIDLSNLNGQNYTNVVIDELQITLGGNYQYVSLDAFTWVKDASSILSTNDLEESLNKIKVFPSVASETININSPYKIQKIEIYDVSGKKTLAINNNFNKIDVKNLIKANYFIKIYTDRGTYNSKFIKK